MASIDKVMKSRLNPNQAQINDKPRLTRVSEKIRSEIEERLGFFPPFFTPALETPEILETLWRQTLSAYVNNPLPVLFREKLFSYLSRYCAVPYCIICHSCALRPLGMTSAEVLASLTEPAPATEIEISKHCDLLATQPSPLEEWPAPGSALDESLMACSILSFLNPMQAEDCRAQLRRSLGEEMCAYLMVFLGYVKTCHLWVEAHPELSYEADKRAQENLGHMLAEEPHLAEFFRNYNELIARERQSRTEAALRESEEKYRRLFESIDQGFCTIEVLFDENERPVDYRFLVVNPAFESQTGIENATGRRMREIAPLHEEHWFELYGRIALTGEPMRFEKTAEQLHRLYDVYAWRVGEPAERKVAVLFNDITERKRAEEALRESELRFRTMVSAAPNLTFETDTGGGNTFVSDQWCAYTGMTAEETAGIGFARAIHPDDAEAVTGRWFAAVRSGMLFESRYRIRAADGSYRWFLARALPGRDAEGRIVRWAGSLMDIDDLVRAEESLRESKERLAGIVSSAMDAIITVDEDQWVVLFNNAAERMFGCPAAEALGRPFNRFIPERFRDAHTELVRRFGETGGASQAMRPLTALRANGEEFPIEAAISKIEVGGRKLYTLILRDITERKQAEAEREQLAREQVARAAAEAANRSKDEFLAMVSHELRSPLNAILGYTRMLRSGPADREAINKATAVVERNAKAQLQIIEDLLDSSRIVTGKLRIEPGPVDLTPALEAALATVRSAAEAKGITLVANFGPSPEQVLGDSTRLQQVVWNLLSNAIKFTPEGGRVELRMEGAADNVRVTVTDTGKGIEPEFLPFVFDRFRQADPSSARHYGGLGLGLSLVKYLVELHGGMITAVSEGLGRGATFTVTLPRRHPEFIAPPLPAVSPREVRTEGAISPGAAFSLEGVSVLVVDDQEEARVVLTQALSKYGARVTAVSSGAEALALLSDPSSSKRPDALILDIAMPDEDGYTVLKKVRALEDRQGAAADRIPAIALTAYARSEDRLRALKSGFNMHVAKPVEPAELAVVIASLTTRRV
jgi:PAS domain S-box-containing protein